MTKKESGARIYGGGNVIGPIGLGVIVDDIGHEVEVSLITKSAHFAKPGESAYEKCKGHDWQSHPDLPGDWVVCTKCETEKQKGFKVDMTNAQILTKAIGKAIGNGYVLPGWMYNPKSIEDVGSAILRCNYVEKLMFSHDFARAFFGDEPIEFMTIHSKDGDGSVTLTFRQPGTIV